MIYIFSIYLYYNENKITIKQTFPSFQIQFGTFTHYNKMHMTLIIVNSLNQNRRKIELLSEKGEIIESKRRNCWVEKGELCRGKSWNYLEGTERIIEKEKFPFETIHRGTNCRRKYTSKHFESIYHTNNLDLEKNKNMYVYLFR